MLVIVSKRLVRLSCNMCPGLPGSSLLRSCAHINKKNPFLGLRISIVSLSYVV